MERKTQKRRFFNKKAGVSVAAAIKVLTSVVLGAAILAGTYGIVKTTVVPTTENKVSSMFEVTDAVELNGGGAGGEVVVPDPVVELKRNGIIPENGAYYKGAQACNLCGAFYGFTGILCPDCGQHSFTQNQNPEVTLMTGDNIPNTPSINDVYIEDDLHYQHTSQGWRVRALVDKDSYGEIISEIAGQPVTDMFNTFVNCTSLTTAPVIPNCVTSMNGTFVNCISLTTAPIIPSSLTDMSGTFFGCTSLTGTIEVNANPTSYNSCFSGTQITGVTGSCSQETKDALMTTK